MGGTERGGLFGLPLAIALSAGALVVALVVPASPWSALAAVLIALVAWAPLALRARGQSVDPAPPLNAASTETSERHPVETPDSEAHEASAPAPSAPGTPAELLAALEAMSDTATPHTEHIRADISRCRQLVQEASVQLRQSFSDLAQGQPAEGGPPDLSAIVRMLQFEDITRQLMETSEEALDRLIRFLEDVKTTAHQQRQSQGDPEEAARQLIDSARCWLGVRHQVVTQNDMDTGDIELF